MSDVVLDSSAFVFALTAITGKATALRTRIGASRCHAPHLIDAEVGNVLRRQELLGDINPTMAQAALGALPLLIDHRYAHTGSLTQATWKLRHTITFYDGLYVALAASVGAPLITTDARLSRAPGLPCQIELIASQG